MLLLFLAACLPTPDAPPFVCQGAPAPAPATPAANAPMGWVQISNLSPPARWSGPGAAAAVAPQSANPWGVAAAPAAPERPAANPQVWFDQQAARTHISVSADAAPLHQLALALGQHLALDVHVAEEVGQRVVTASYKDTSLASFLQMLRVDHDVGVRYDGGVLTFTEDPPMCAWCDQQLVVSLFETDTLRGQPAAIAAVYCQDLATPVGSAAVVGDQIYVRDTAAAIATFRALYDGFQEPEGE